MSEPVKKGRPKNPETVTQIKGKQVDPQLFNELLDLKIIVFYRNLDGSEYPGLSPRWRREIHQLGEPQGFILKELLKMTHENAQIGLFENAPGGQPVPGPEMDLINIKEVNKVE